MHNFWQRGRFSAWPLCLIWCLGRVAGRHLHSVSPSVCERTDHRTGLFAVNNWRFIYWIHWSKTDTAFVLNSLSCPREMSCYLSVLSQRLSPCEVSSSKLRTAGQNSQRSVLVCLLVFWAHSRWFALYCYARSYPGMPNVMTAGILECRKMIFVLMFCWSGQSYQKGPLSAATCWLIVCKTAY